MTSPPLQSAPDDPIAGLHGSYAGAMRHQVLGIPRCRPCKKAAADYKRGWRVRGVPRVHANPALGALNHATAGAAHASRHCPQWQYVAAAAAPATEKRTAPHAQPPCSKTRALTLSPPPPAPASASTRFASRSGTRHAVGTATASA